MSDTTTKTRTQLLDDLRAAKMALTLAEHQAQQVQTHPQPTSSIEYARETAHGAVTAARAACDEIRRQRDALPATPPKTRTITLTDRPPVTIREDQWPIIATGDWGDSPNGIRSQSNREATIRVRAHADGRCIVYGVHSSQWQGEGTVRAGYLCARDMVIGAIHDVARAIDAPASCVRECIADLPAEELSTGKATS